MGACNSGMSVEGVGDLAEEVEAEVRRGELDSKLSHRRRGVGVVCGVDLVGF